MMRYPDQLYEIQSRPQWKKTPLSLRDLWIHSQVQAINFVHDGSCRELEPVDHHDPNTLYKPIMLCLRASILSEKLAGPSFGRS